MSFEIGVLIENLPGLFSMTERMQAFVSVLVYAEQYHEDTLFVVYRGFA